jgi:hypothetical protein
MRVASAHRRTACCVPLIVLSVVLSGCVTVPKGEKLPVPPCPPEFVELARGWIGDEAQHFKAPIPWEIHHKDGKVDTLRVWAMTVEDRRALELWVVKLLTCAKARGAVIEEFNR